MLSFFPDVEPLVARVIKKLASRERLLNGYLLQVPKLSFCDILNLELEDWFGTTINTTRPVIKPDNTVEDVDIVLYFTFASDFRVFEVIDMTGDRFDSFDRESPEEGQALTVADFYQFIRRVLTNVMSGKEIEYLEG